MPTIAAQELIGDEEPEIQHPILEYSCLPTHPDYAHDDMTPLLQIATVTKPKVILELGTAYGNTVANLCRTSEATIYTVNALPEQISGSAITFDALSKDDIGSVYRLYGYTERVVQIYANTMSLDLGAYLNKGSIQLAIIDACHDTDYVIHDFLLVAPFLQDGGLVLLHDTHPEKSKNPAFMHLQSSYLACVRLRMAGYDIRHLRNTWWGAWKKGGFEKT